MKTDGNFTPGRLCCIFPPFINCMGKSLSSSVIVKVAVMILSSFDPFIGTVFAPFGTKILFDTGTCFEGI